MSIEKYKERLKTVGVLYIDLFPFRKLENDNIQFLIIKRKSGVELSDSWQAISGKIRENEKISNAFFRQCNEKIGVEPKRIFKIDHINTFYDNYYDTVMMVPVAACEVDSSSNIILSDLHVDYKWVSASEAEEYLIWPNQLTSINLVERILKNKVSPFNMLRREK